MEQETQPPNGCNYKPEVYMSENIGELAAALAIAQGQFKPIERKCNNPFFKSKYADLAAINEGVKEALSKSGLAVVQAIIPDEAVAIVESYLLHKSGQWIKSTAKLHPVKSDPQGMGSALTYARRYSLSALLCVATEDEDDGNSASGNKKPEGKKEEKPTTPQEKGEHYCEQHKRNWFKRGKMKSFAHPIEGTKEWCYEHKSDDEKQATTEPVDAIGQAEDQTPLESHHRDTEGYIDLVWLEDSLDKLSRLEAWRELKVSKALSERYGVNGRTSLEMASQLDQKQAAEFVAKVQETLSMM